MMKFMELETWEVAYSEKANEMRLLLNTATNGSMVIILDGNSLPLFLEQVGREGAFALRFPAHSIKPREFGEENSYRLGDEDISSHFLVEGEELVSLFMKEQDRQQLEASIWDMGDVITYVMG